MTSPDRPSRAFARLRTLAVSTMAVVLAAGAALAIQPHHHGAAGGALMADASPTATPTTSPTTSPTGGPTSPPTAAATPTLPPAPVLTHVRVSTFNMLGNSHTAPGGNKHGWASGTQRMKWAAQIIRGNHLQIVGMQEFQVPQFNEFQTLFGASYGVYPARYLGDVAVQNSIAWDRSQWRALEQHTIKIPYFGGAMTDEPYMLMQNLSTGQLLWVYNSHNPAGIKGAGDTTKYRAEAVATEVKLFASLEAQYPGVPILDTGDKNDVAPYFCPIMAQTDLHAAAGGGYNATTKVCTVPKPATIDWIFGSPNITFSHYTILSSALVHKTTDHDVYYADATLPPVNQIRYVVGIDLEGLTAKTLTDPSVALPNLRRLIAAGASTTNARTTAENVGTLPNAVGMLTSRPASLRVGGTGLHDTTGTPPSVTQAHGSYVESIFDAVHNAGMGTGMWGTNAQLGQVVAKTWHTSARPELTTVRTTLYDRSAMTELITDLRHSPKAFSFLDLSAANRMAAAHGSDSAQYDAALHALDSYVGTLVRAINASQTLRGRTVILLTSNHGGVTPAALKVTDRRAYRVPFIAWGPGIAPGSSIYALNSQLRDPGTGNPRYLGPQPMRNLDLGNVAASLLGLPAIPGSKVDSHRDVFLVTQPAQ